jgi:hypothetical protein
MATVLGLYKKVKAIDTDKACIDSLRETKETIADLNAVQMFTGLRADGTEILPDYKNLTIEIKKTKGQPTDRVTLRDTGAFYQGINTTITQTSVITDSTDPKTEKLKKKYETSKGKIFGLGGEYHNEYMNEQLRPTFKKKMEAATGLKLK